MIKDKTYKKYVKCKKCGRKYGLDENEGSNSLGRELCPICAYHIRNVSNGYHNGPMAQLYKRYIDKEKLK